MDGGTNGCMQENNNGGNEGKKEWKDKEMKKEMVEERQKKFRKERCRKVSGGRSNNVTVAKR